MFVLWKIPCFWCTKVPMYKQFCNFYKTQNFDVCKGYCFEKNLKNVTKMLLFERFFRILNIECDHTLERTNSHVLQKSQFSDSTLLSIHSVNLFAPNSLQNVQKSTKWDDVLRRENSKWSNFRAGLTSVLGCRIA